MLKLRRYWPWKTVSSHLKQILAFLFTLNSIRLSSLVQVAKCLGSLQKEKRASDSEETGTVFNHIFPRKTAIIITPKHGTTIFFPIAILF